MAKKSKVMIEKTFQEFPKMVTSGKDEDGKDIRKQVNSAEEEAEAVKDYSPKDASKDKKVKGWDKVEK